MLVPFSFCLFKILNLLTVVDIPIRRGWPFVPHEPSELVSGPEVTLACVVVFHDRVDPVDPEGGPQIMELVVEIGDSLADLRNHPLGDERPEILPHLLPVV